MRIRAATPADAVPIAELHVRAWKSGYRGQVADAYLDALTADDLLPNLVWSLEHAPAEWRMWVAEDDGAIIGFASTGPSTDADARPSARISELFAIYVDPARLGTGVGRGLLAHAVDDLRARGAAAATLWVFGTNARARRFVEGAGWSEDGATTIERIGEEHLATVRYRTTFAA
ncbi:MAG: N-acetyltransferase family protein [Actinomycetota bacterium]